MSNREQILAAFIEVIQALEIERDDGRSFYPMSPTLIMMAEQKYYRSDDPQPSEFVGEIDYWQTPRKAFGPKAPLRASIGQTCRILAQRCPHYAIWEQSALYGLTQSRIAFCERVNQSTISRRIKKAENYIIETLQGLNK